MSSTSDSASISPLAPDSFPVLPPIAGVGIATFAAGLRYTGRDDLFVASLAEGTSVAGVFTTSLCPSAPVDWCRQQLVGRTARALVCNAGNANAFTGQAGMVSAAMTAEVIAESLTVAPDQVFLASTGVIGEPMPDQKIAEALPQLAAAVAPSSAEGWKNAALAIGTTDTFAKGASRRIDGAVSHVVGIAKGSGMIAPNMATMLAFVFTDLPVEPTLLQECLSIASARTFNRITVDSDTSTSDTVLLFATGEQIDDELVDRDDPRLESFQAALDAVLSDLAHQIVRDGEGATKFIEVTVSGAADDAAAEIIAKSIANSPLVKTAIAAEDANWGRIIMAVGKAGQAADRDRIELWIGTEQVTFNGAVLASYSEARATEHLQGDEVTIKVDVGVGPGQATVWTCDLTHRYIDINAGYRS
jgi:glutamate N-acetyltransferase/amino-acid N-acetyltransferase